MTKSRGANLFILVYIVAASAFSLYYGMEQFGGYDLSPVIDLQSRLARGEIPGVDFINTIPLTMVLILKIYGALFAASWVSLMWYNIIFSALCAFIVVIYWPAAFQDGKKIATIIMMYLPMLVTNHIWHSTISQLLAIEYIILSLHFFMTYDIKFKYIRNIMLALCAGFFFYSKQNIGLPLIGVICAAVLCLALLTNEAKRPILEFVAWNITGVFAASMILIIVLHVDFPALIHTFTAVLSRAKISQEQYKAITFDLFLTGSMGGFFLLSICTFPWRNYLGRPELAIICSSLVLSILPLATDWDTKFNDAPLFLFSLVLLTNAKSSFTRNAILVLTALPLGAAAREGVIRRRMHDVGPGNFWEPGPLTRVEDGYFCGLLAGPRFHEVRREIRTTLKDWGQDSRVFCGPRIEFCYMDNAIQSPRELPLWWHPGSSYPLFAEGDVIENFKANKFTLLIFLHGDRTRMPRPILDYIAKTYTRTEGYDLMDVYRIRQ